MSIPPPSPPELPIQAAARLLAEGRPARAADRLGEIVRGAPTYAAAHVLLATALESAGEPEAALDAWTHAAALVPRSPLVHRERERLLEALRAPEEDAELPPPVPAAPPLLESPYGGEPVPFSADSLVGGPEAEPVPPEMTSAGAPASATPAPEVAPTESASNAPLPAYGDLQALEATDLFFGGTPSPPSAEPSSPTPESASPPEPVTPPEVSDAPPASGADASLEEAPASPEPARPPTPLALPPSDRPATAADTSDDGEWVDIDPAVTELLPPEEGAPRPVPVVPETVEPDEGGWALLAEDDLPKPPPSPRVEPDVVTPESAADASFAVADELDALISQLEDAPRIRPDPAFSGPSVSFDAGDMSEMYSETLAEIYAAQHQYVEAALVYETLAARRPEAAAEMLRKAAALRKRG